jgi:hypothetical protein
VPHQNFDAISAVYAANLLAHELEESASGAKGVYNLEDCQQELATLGIDEQIPEWRAMAKGIPALLPEAL